MNNKLIKSIIQPGFSVELYETPDGEFIVQQDIVGGLQHQSRPMDLKSAFHAFDQILQELEGN